MKLNNFYINEKINNSFLENYNIKKNNRGKKPEQLLIMLLSCIHSDTTGSKSSLTEHRKIYTSLTIHARSNHNIFNSFIPVRILKSTKYSYIYNKYINILTIQLVVLVHNDRYIIDSPY